MTLATLTPVGKALEVTKVPGMTTLEVLLYVVVTTAELFVNVVCVVTIDAVPLPGAKVNWFPREKYPAEST